MNPEITGAAIFWISSAFIVWLAITIYGVIRIKRMRPILPHWLRRRGRSTMIRVNWRKRAFRVVAIHDPDGKVGEIIVEPIGRGDEPR